MFLLLTFSWWAGPLSFGENYTPFRFFLPPFLCLLACRRISSSIAATRTALELLVGEAVILLVSPELAIAFGGATILYVLLRYLSSRAARHLRVLGLFVLGSAPLFWGAAGTGLLLTLHSMSHGGYNFPLLPVMQHIPVIGLLLVASCVFVYALRTRHFFGPVEYLTLLGLLCFRPPSADPTSVISSSTALAR